MAELWQLRVIGLAHAVASRILRDEHGRISKRDQLLTVLRRVGVGWPRRALQRSGLVEFPAPANRCFERPRDAAGQGSQRFGLAVKIATRCGVRRHRCGREVDSASKTKRPRSLTLWGRFARAALPRGVVLAAGSPEGPQVQEWGALQTSRPRATER
jgi:hypothetical protein